MIFTLKLNYLWLLEYILFFLKFKSLNFKFKRSSKSYVVKFSESIREELKRLKSDVKISVLCPGPVKTNFEKTANVQFQVSKAKSSDVANYALKHLNKFYIIPGFGTKLAHIGAKLLPTSLVSKMVYKVQKKRVG